MLNAASAGLPAHSIASMQMGEAGRRCNLLGSVKGFVAAAAVSSFWIKLPQRRKTRKRCELWEKVK